MPLPYIVSSRTLFSNFRIVVVNCNVVALRDDGSSTANDMGVIDVDGKGIASGVWICARECTYNA